MPMSFGAFAARLEPEDIDHSAINDDEPEKHRLIDDTTTSTTKLWSSNKINNNLNARTVTPIGSILPWLKSYSNTPSLPDGWVECNGQTLNDSDSPYDGQTIPDLNGNNRFLRGNSTSGGTGGAASHDHSYTINILEEHDEGTGSAFNIIKPSTTAIGINHSSNLPPHYEVVWIMRVK